MRYGWLAAAVAVLFLASCGGGSDSDTAASAPREEGRSRQAAEKPIEPGRKLQHLDLTLAGGEGPESAGILMAERHGHFADTGLDVAVLVPISPVNAIGYVVKGFVDLGIAPAPQVVLARSKGLPIVAVGSVIPRPTAAMIWLEGSNIDGIADLEGKTIAIPGLSFQRAFLESVLRRAGLTLEDVEVKTVGYQLVPALVSGRADAIFGGSPNIEGVEIESRGLRPVVVPADDLGIPAYDQLMVIARSERVAGEPQMIRRFMSALRRGTAAAIEDPEAVVKAIRTGDEALLDATRRKDVEPEVRATLPVLSRSGRTSPDRARRLVAWMYAQESIQRKVPLSSLLNEDYLPRP